MSQAYKVWLDALLFDPLSNQIADASATYI